MPSLFYVLGLKVARLRIESRDKKRCRFRFALSCTDLDQTQPNVFRPIQISAKFHSHFGEWRPQILFLPARRIAKHGICYGNVSVCLSVIRQYCV